VYSFIAQLKEDEIDKQDGATAHAAHVYGTLGRHVCGQNHFYNHLSSKISGSFSARFFFWSAVKNSVYSNNPQLMF
jgi:hypothetical protein